MITCVCGLPGVGKSALLAFFAKSLYQTQGRSLLRNCVEAVELLNLKRKHKLTAPTKCPIFSDFEIKFLVDYETYYSTYFINGFYVGLENDDVPIINTPPYSTYFLSEVQRYYDSRKSKTLPDWVSRWFETHRHNHYNIYMDLQRIGLLDLNIRDLGAEFLEVIKMEHSYNSFGFITGTKWYCNKFDSWEDFDVYLTSGKKTANVVTFENRGNIFNCYNSYAYADEFVPGVREDYTYLEHKSEVGSIGDLNAKLRQYYKFDMPDNYRKRSVSTC